jgi:hypothetical protein
MRSAPEQKGVVRDSIQKGWRRPVLRKLPIAETATKGKTRGREEERART